MFDILSTAELTVSAAIAVGFLRWRWRRPRAAGPRFWSRSAHGLRLCLAIGATGALSPALGGAPALGLTVVLPIAALVWAYFALPSVRTAMAATPLPALIALHAIRLLGFTFRRSLRRGPPSRAVCAERGMGRYAHRRDRACRSPGRLRDSARACGRSSCLWNALGVADLVIALTLGPLSAPGPLQVFVGPPDSFADDDVAVAHHSGLPGPDPLFHSRRHLPSAARQERSLGAGACVDRRRPVQSRPENSDAGGMPRRRR